MLFRQYTTPTVGVRPAVKPPGRRNNIRRMYYRMLYRSKCPLDYINANIYYAVSAYDICIKHGCPRTVRSLSICRAGKLRDFLSSDMFSVTLPSLPVEYIYIHVKVSHCNQLDYEYIRFCSFRITAKTPLNIYTEEKKQQIRRELQ